jgi:acetyl esterase/lipase
MSNSSYEPDEGQLEGAMMSTSTDTTTAYPKLAGRHDDPDRDLRTDPRLKPRLRAALAAFGLDAAAGPPPIDRTAAPEAIAEFVGGSHAAFNGLYEALPNDLPGDDDSVAFSTETIVGVDGNDITLRIYRSANFTGPLPCTIYIHGGGMTILDAFAKVHQQWCEDLAATGMVVVGVDFRNAYSAEGMQPFPAGLNDCTSALKWVNDHRGQLGITTVVLQGESGGANLVLATALKAKREGYLDAIDGVYAMVPYISGGYGWPDSRKLRELPSMIENDGYFLNCAMMDVIVAVYDPDSENAENPLAWPYFATEADLVGLPPHVISVNELDPLRDEGMAYYRKLIAVGVPVVGRVNLGLTHGSEMIFRQAVPEDYFATVQDIKRFADSLSGR